MGFPSKIKDRICLFYAEISTVRSVRFMARVHLEFGVGKDFLGSLGFDVVKVFGDPEFEGGKSLGVRLLVIP